LGDKGKSRAFSDFRRMIGLDKQAAKAPMRMAFMIPNPLLPSEYFSRPQLDSFVIEMNADVDHSLLDCPGRYSVRVATFTGAGSFDQGATNASNDDGAESRLIKAAENAHRLTEALRKQGWQAWGVSRSGIECRLCWEPFSGNGWKSRRTSATTS